MLNDEVRAMLEDVPEWTPLDSAPRDGTDVIVGNTREPRAMGLARYNGNAWDVKPLGGWTRPEADEITHWMPLPEDEVQKLAEDLSLT
ncbi:MAG TPA: DUF551 domain-containing protein [Steroidobacteraceae bacterium]|nr:DUF551 domain-containing protein [Steroidobacteraceae bacterium]